MVRPARCRQLRADPGTGRHGQATTGRWTAERCGPCRCAGAGTALLPAQTAACRQIASDQQGSAVARTTTVFARLLGEWLSASTSPASRLLCYRGLGNCAADTPAVLHCPATSRARPRSSERSPSKRCICCAAFGPRPVRLVPNRAPAGTRDRSPSDAPAFEYVTGRGGN